MTNHRRVVICSLGVPHPREGASLVIIYNFIEPLRRAGFDILHIVLLEGDSAAAGPALESYRTTVESPHYEIVTVTTRKFVDQGPRAHTIDLSGCSRAIERATKFRADLVIAFDIVPAWVAASIPSRRKLAWLGDLNFQTTYYHGLYGLQERPWRLLSFAKFWLAARNWRHVYAKVLADYDEVIVSAESSVAQIAGLGLRNHGYRPYPWPVDDPPSDPSPKPATPTFMFFGNLVGLGSRSALHFMVAEVYRRLIGLWGQGGFQILIAGRGHLPEWFSVAIADKPEFVRIGFVEDLPATLAGCHGVLVPIDVPVGNRTRVLYALSQGALVIAHANVALGNPALIDGETCALGHDGKSFVARMERAFADPDWSQRIGEAGRTAYMQLFHPGRAGADFLSRVEALLAPPQADT
ncbi:glycosyltransferase [Rhodopseudomonas sp. BR0M22]|uniref:glycosyltransferase n=1 Tax=Rhodopseudomonas sp. BR0M22 TaxID=2269369 RepID=UPI0013DFD399|nr:glycosyltransferase [Rhodopseudomonas sp. BR0M22]